MVILNSSGEQSNQENLVGRDEHIAPDAEEMEALIRIVA